MELGNVHSIITHPSCYDDWYGNKYVVDIVCKYNDPFLRTTLITDQVFAKYRRVYTCRSTQIAIFSRKLVEAIPSWIITFHVTQEKY